jgi:hypothetical protein
VRLGTLDNSGNLQVNGIVQSLNGNLYLVNSSTAVVSDGANLLLYANAGAVFTRASGMYVQNSAGQYVNVYCGASQYPGGPYISAAGGGPTLVYRTISPNQHSFEFISGGYAPIYASAFTPASARKFKTDIQILVDPLAVVLDPRVHGVSYTELASGEHKLGFVADDWLGVEPSVVGLNEWGDVETLDYDRISAVTFEALKQHVIATNKRLDALEARLAA